jgi:hypothetical protein
MRIEITAVAHARESQTGANTLPPGRPACFVAGAVHAVQQMRDMVGCVRSAAEWSF